MNINDLTANEITFMKRMLPHFMAGKSAAEAAQAVLDDDARLAAAFFKRSTSNFVPTADERGWSHQTSQQTGDVIASELSRTVYERLRASDAIKEAA